MSCELSLTTTTFMYKSMTMTYPYEGYLTSLHCRDIYLCLCFVGDQINRDKSVHECRLWMVYVNNK